MKEEKRKCGFIHVIQYEGVTKDGQKYRQFETHAEGSQHTIIDCICSLVSYLAENGDASVGDIIGEMLFICAYRKMKEQRGAAFYAENNSKSVHMAPETVEKIKEILKKKGEKEENGNSET